MSKRLITNVRAVNEGNIFDTDVLIEDGRITRVDTEVVPDGSTEILDATGLYLIPGMIVARQTFGGSVRLRIRRAPA